MKILELWKIVFLFGMIIVAMITQVSADEIRYKPVNPAFGGNPFNGPYLLSNASEQKQFSAPERKRASAVDEFSDSIQRSLISQISRDIADQILGEDARESGTFSVGETTLDFKRVNDQVIINVQDIKTGGQTTIELPVPQY